MVTWDAAADRHLLLLALKQLKGSLNYDAIAAEFGEQVTLNTLRIRMSTLKKMGESGNFQKGKITKHLKTTKNGVKTVKKEAPIKQEMDKVEVLDEEWL